MKRSSLAGRPSPHVTALSPRVLTRAAFLLGRGFPVEDAASRLECCPRKLRVELDRLGVDRVKPPHTTSKKAPGLSLAIALSPTERVTLGTAALDHCLYEHAVGAILLRTILQRGRTFVDALLSEGGSR